MVLAHSFRSMAALIFAGMISSGTMAQDCPPLKVDIKKGLINGISPKAGMEEVKSALPCFTGETEEGVVYNCGGGVFYLNHDFYFYTGRNYIEVRDEFKGSCSREILGLNENAVQKAFGNPVKKLTGYSEDDNWLYKMPWGTLCITFEDGRAVKFGLYATRFKKLELCI